MRKYLSRVKSVLNKIDYLHEITKTYDLKNPKVLMGRIMAELTRNKPIKSLADVEFQVFSQFGDDGIIQYLVSNIDIPHRTFIEFGVENYTESNTRFLLLNNNWSGLVMDGLQANIDYIKKDPVTVINELHTRCVFITTDNINKLMQDFINLGYDKEVGLLSIDIDGNDYWVWKEITAINPVIVVTEYNAVFEKNAWTVPYKPDFYRLKEHSSHQYWGASLKAFCLLAEQKGYYFVGCNSNGNNAYFVRKDKIGNLKPLSCEEGFVMSKFMEDVDSNGNGIHGKARFELLRGASVVNVETGKTEKI